MANRIVLELLADANPMVKALNQAQSNLDSFRKSAESAGASLGSGVNRALDAFTNVAKGGTAAAGVLAGGLAAVATAAVALTLSAGKQAEAIDHLSQKTGIATQTLQSWSVIMAQNNFQAESLTAGMRTLSKHIVEARDPSSKAAAAFEEMGISITKVGSTESTIRAVADRFKDMPDGADKARLAVQLFGKAGLELIPILNRGAAALDQSRQEAVRFGLVLRTDQLQALAAADDAYDKLGQALDGLKTRLALVFAGPVTHGIDQMIGGLTTLTNVVSNYGAALEQVKKDHPILSSLAPSLAASMAAVKASQVPPPSPPAAVLGPDQNAQVEERIRLQQREVELGETMRVQHIAAYQASQRAAAAREKHKHDALAAMAAEIELGQRREAFAKDVSRQVFAETFAEDERRMADAYAGSAVMIENVTTKQKALRAMQDDIQKGLDLQKQTVPELGSTWTTTMEQLSQSAGFAFGQIRAQFGNAVAGMVLGTQTFQQFMQQMYSTLINMTVQFGLNMALEWLKQQAAELTTHAATQAAKVGINTASNAAVVAGNAAAAGATVGIWEGAGAAIIGTFGAIFGAIKGFFISTILPFFATIGKALMAFLSAIAAAAKATIFGIPYGIAVLAGVAVIGAAIGSLMAFAFDQGGVVTGPTLGMIGEAGSSEAVIPLNSRGASFVRDALGGGGGEPIMVAVHIGDDVIMRKVARKLPSAIRLRGVPFR